MDIDTVEYCTDIITESHRTEEDAPLSDVANLAKTVDQMYSKAYLRDTDPSPWSDNVGATCFPATYPLKENFVVLKPWTYIPREPVTDAGGWIYKTDFTSPVEGNKHNPLTSKVRYRSWKRVSVPRDQLELAQASTTAREDNKHRFFAYNLNTIDRVFNTSNLASQQETEGTADQADKMHINYKVQLVWENDRMRAATAGGASNRPDPARWTVDTGPKSSSSTPSPTVPLTDADLEVPVDWCAVRGFSFLVDTATDAAGWRYACSFSSLDWSNNYDKTVGHSVKVRKWARVICPSKQAPAARTKFTAYIENNSRGVIREGDLLKQGSLRTNWSLRSFQLTDNLLQYSVGAKVLGTIEINSAHTVAAVAFGACSELSEAGQSYAFEIQQLEKERKTLDDEGNFLDAPVNILHRKKSNIFGGKKLKTFLKMDGMSMKNRQDWIDVLRNQIWMSTSNRIKNQVGSPMSRDVEDSQLGNEYVRDSDDDSEDELVLDTPVVIQRPTMARQRSSTTAIRDTLDRSSCISTFAGKDQGKIDSYGVFSSPISAQSTEVQVDLPPAVPPNPNPNPRELSSSVRDVGDEHMGEAVSSVQPLPTVQEEMEHISIIGEVVAPPAVPSSIVLDSCVPNLLPYMTGGTTMSKRLLPGERKHSARFVWIESSVVSCRDAPACKVWHLNWAKNSTYEMRMLAKALNISHIHCQLGKFGAGGATKSSTFTLIIKDKYLPYYEGTEGEHNKLNIKPLYQEFQQKKVTGIELKVNTAKMAEEMVNVLQQLGNQY